MSENVWSAMHMVMAEVPEVSSKYWGRLLDQANETPPEICSLFQHTLTPVRSFCWIRSRISLHFVLRQQCHQCRSWNCTLQGKFSNNLLAQWHRETPFYSFLERDFEIATHSENIFPAPVPRLRRAYIWNSVCYCHLSRFYWYECSICCSLNHTRIHGCNEFFLFGSHKSKEAGCFWRTGASCHLLEPCSFHPHTLHHGIQNQTTWTESYPFALHTLEALYLETNIRNCWLREAPPQRKPCIFGHCPNCDLTPPIA